MRRCSSRDPEGHEYGAELPESAFNAGQYSCKACKAASGRRQWAIKRSATKAAPVTSTSPGWPVPMSEEATEPGSYATGPVERFTDTTWASIPDVHDPNHDKHAWAVALEVVHRHKPKLLHIAGDLMDCESLSVHEPTSLRTPMSFVDELASANRRLDEIAQSIPSDCKVVFTEGNHEFRWVREFAKFKHHTALQGTTMPELLGFKRRGWLWVDFRRSYKVPGTNLRLTHSLEKFGLNSVRDHAKDIGDGSIVFGDIHRREMIELGDAEGRYRFSACPGWLGDTERISYMHRTKCLRTWSHGLMTGWVIDGRAYPQTIPIVDRAAVFEGRLIRAA